MQDPGRGLKSMGSAGSQESGRVLHEGREDRVCTTEMPLWLLDADAWEQGHVNEESTERQVCVVAGVGTLVSCDLGLK